jgi:hypothetical protein
MRLFQASVGTKGYSHVRMLGPTVTGKTGACPVGCQIEEDGYA